MLEKLYRPIGIARTLNIEIYNEGNLLYKGIVDNAPDDLKSNNILIPKEGYSDMKIPHLAATLNAIVHNLILFDNQSNDLARWAGDLLQFGGIFGSHIADTEFSNNDVYNLIGGIDDALAYRLLGTDDDGAITADKAGFGFEDLELDLDAVGMAYEIANGQTIYEVFEYYYNTDKYNQRINRFLAYTIGYDETKTHNQILSELTEYAKKYTLLQVPTAVLFTENRGYNKDAHGNILAEQFAKKIVDMM